MRSPPMTVPRPLPADSTFARVARGVPLGLALAAVLYAGLKTRPEMRVIPGLPAAWGDWLDAHDFLKNAVGFAVLTGAAHLAFPRTRARNAAAVALLVAGIELAQLFLPQRCSDVNDVVAGWLGVAVASVVGLAMSRRQREGRT